jgi:myosin heavy subunit
MLAFLENLRITRLNHCATVIQKNLKAKYYRRKYLEARNAILLIQQTKSIIQQKSLPRQNLCGFNRATFKVLSG